MTCAGYHSAANRRSDMAYHSYCLLLPRPALCSMKSLDHLEVVWA
jgi:hypothetical protein